MDKIVKKMKVLFQKYEEEISIASTMMRETIKLASPVVSISMDTLKSIFENYNEIHCRTILNGLSKSENVEMRVNQLSQFSKKTKGALILSRLGQQALQSKSSVTLVVLGMMLSKCSENDLDLSYEDVIVMEALQSATDFEIKYFLEICKDYIDDDGYINQTKINQATFAKEYLKTLEWGKANRVIGTTGLRRMEEIDFDLCGEFYIVDECTLRLLHYIMEAKQVLNYDN